MMLVKMGWQRMARRWCSLLCDVVNMNRGRFVLYLLFLAAVGLLLTMVRDLHKLNQTLLLSAQRTVPEHPASQRRHSDPTLMIDDSEARALRSRGGRVLCWVPTIARQLGSKVKAVNSTWIKRCDGHLYFVEGATSVYPDVVSLDVPPGYYNLTTKVVAVMQYLYLHHLHEYDWFLKGDDDAYVIMENLRYVLAQYDHRRTVYVGHLYKMRHPQGYMSGGASYVISREALRKVVEDGYQKNKCATRGRYEDVEVGICLHKVGVASHNSRDRFGRDTFHPLRPSTHIAGPIPAVQLEQDRFAMVSGKECCSQLTVSFHKLDPTLIAIFDHLLYRTSVYGRVLDMEAVQGLVQPGTVPPLAST